MKQLTRIFALCLLASCSKHHTPEVDRSTAMVIVHDITDTMDITPAAEPLIDLYDFTEYRDQAASFRLVLISDRVLNPVQEMHIEDGATTERSNTTDDIDFREHIVYSFCDELRNSVADFHKRYVPCPPLKHSECFATIASELQRLVDSKATNKIMIIFSDLQENGMFSCYTPEGRKLLENNPGEVAKLLQRRCALPASLAGVTVFVVYNPMTREQDLMFDKMLSIYKQLLHARGANVVVQATNKFYLP